MGKCVQTFDWYCTYLHLPETLHVLQLCLSAKPDRLHYVKHFKSFFFLSDSGNMFHIVQIAVRHADPISLL